ncbi:MAG: D-alanine--D-alanine ligase [Chthoniobacterales bacterium]
MSLQNKTIAVLKGGPGAERNVSLSSAAAVEKALESLGARVVPVDVSDENFQVPGDADLAFNIIHGTFGEDGQIQAILDDRRVPYTGENAESSRVAFDKIASKRAFEAAGVPTPQWQVLKSGEHPTIPIPLVAKPPREGSSVGVHIVKETHALQAALDDCFARDEEVLIEEFVAGRELTVGILGDTAFPVIEIVPKVDFYSYENKYTAGASEYFCPAKLPADTTGRVKAAALGAHRALGLHVYSRVDVLLDQNDNPLVLEVNTIPGMTETSLLPKGAAATGLSFADLCERIATLSLAKPMSSPSQPTTPTPPPAAE